MAYAAKIIDRFGGTRAAANALKLPPTTVQSWKDSGLIPAKHQANVLRLGQSLDPPLQPSDFFDVGPSPREEAA